MTDLKIIRMQELADLFSVSKQTIWRLSKSGELPPKIKISGRAVGWLQADIKQYLESKKETETA